MTNQTIYDQLVEILGTPGTEEIQNMYYIIAILLVILTISLFYKLIASIFNK